jgi:hypothetical protein
VIALVVLALVILTLASIVLLTGHSTRTSAPRPSVVTAPSEHVAVALTPPAAPGHRRSRCYPQLSAGCCSRSRKGSYPDLGQLHERCVERLRARAVDE